MDDKNIDDYVLEGDNLESIYMNFLDYVNEHIKVGHDPLEIAAVLMTQSLSMYRTVLSTTEYDNIIDRVVDLKDLVIKFEQLSPNKGNLH